MQKLARNVLGTSNIDNTSLLSGPVSEALYPVVGAGAGTGSIEAIEASELVLVIGADICRTHPVLNVSIVKARKNGATSVLVSAENSTHSPLIDRQIITNDLVGTFASVLKLLVGQGKLSDSRQKVVDSLGKTPVSSAAEEIASLLSGRKASILFGEGILECGDPAGLITLLYNVLVASGNPQGLIPLWTEGNAQGVCDMGALPGFLPGWQPTTTPGLGRQEMINGKVKALYTTEGDEQPPAGVEFLILQDIYPSKLMASADVVLPAAAFTETQGTVTSVERRVQPVRGCATPPGSALADWEIISKIAAGLGAEGFGFAAAEEITVEIDRKSTL